MTLTEWQDKYEKESDMPFRLHEADGIFFDEEKGFLGYNKIDDIFWIQELCGNIKYLFGVAEIMAKELGCTKIMSVSKRNPKAMERLLKCKFVGHLFEAEVKYG